MKSRSRFALYCTVVVLFAVILGWWLVFFSRLGSVLAERVQETGVQLTSAEIDAIRTAADASTRMLLFEGGFLVALLLVGVLLLLRSMRQEVALHRQRQNFLSAVTHELKTPIASARLHVESLLLGRMPPEKHQPYLQTATDELDRLGRMVDHLLETARATARPAELEFERLDLAAFVVEVAPQLVDSDAIQLDIEIDAPASVWVNANAAALETILRNLFSNASKYGGDPPRAKISVSGDSGHARLNVRDFGPGVHDERPGRMFDPFIRGKDELVRDRPGVGLGLFLVAELARAHGGSARAGNVDEGSGFTVEVSLPLTGGDA
jgi:two-component system phosphate regulon sensor histidine kinase PhoR